MTETEYMNKRENLIGNMKTKWEEREHFRKLFEGPKEAPLKPLYQARFEKAQEMWQKYSDEKDALDRRWEGQQRRS